MIKKALTASEIARYCDVTPRTIVQWISEGKIDAYRTPGKHSRVKQEDFLRFLKKYDMPIPDELKGKSGKKRILIVDDDQGIVHSIRRMLVTENIYEIEVAYDGFSAGQKFVSFKPDLITLDIRMPKIDGFEVCSLIRKDLKNKDVKILIISGTGNEEGFKRIMNLGANDYLPKPFHNKDLKLTIQELLGLDTK